METMADNKKCFRTLEKVESVLKHAKFDPRELTPITQVLSFEEKNPVEDNLLLVELDPSLLNILLKGDSLAFKGESEESAVLCSKDRTFEVKAAEISNSLVVVPHIAWSENASQSEDGRKLEDKRILKIFYEYLEFRPCAPRLQKVRFLLDKCQYRGPEYEINITEDNAPLYTFYDLLEKVQASEQELLVSLKENFAVLIENHWRFLDFDYHFRVLSLILGLIDENSWSLDEINRSEVIESLSDVVPSVVLNHLLDGYSQESNKTSGTGEKLLRLRDDKICAFLAQVLLKPAGKFNYSDFLSAWQQSVPEGMKTDPNYLKGIAITDLTSKPPVILYFPEWERPEDINDRFRELFSVQEKWTFAEIQPYIERLATAKMSVNALLTKFARTSTLNGVKVYSARHGK